MTAPVIEAIENPPVAAEIIHSEKPGLLRIWVSTLSVWFFPRSRGELWVEVSLPRAVAIALFNSLCGATWAFIVIIGYRLWNANSPTRPLHWGNAAAVAAQTLLVWRDAFHSLALIEKCVLLSGFAMLIVSAYLLPFFVLLPFAARPGPSKPCVRHVARTILLSTGFMHLGGLIFIALFVQLIEHVHSPFATSISPVLLAVTGMGFWWLAAMISAVRVDYRKPADLPQPHDPWCDECGYNLVAADLAGRCPECGKAVSESIGAATRPPTAWENRPSLLNSPAIAAQLSLLIRHPRKLFFAMPSLTGQRAAQRWLLFSVTFIGLLALSIVPAIAYVNESQWSLDIVTGAIIMAFVWALLALMMVGIETAGIATFSRLRGLNGGVYLAAAAKVTSYSSILMAPWVLLGGVQLVAVIYFMLEPRHIPHGVTMRTQQILLASSLAIAHIGGLLWYELTVYRGIRGIQYANK